MPRQSNSAPDKDFDVFAGELTRDYLKTQGPFDCAVILDVVEHLEKPDFVLCLSELRGTAMPVNLHDAMRAALRWQG